MEKQEFILNESFGYHFTSITLIIKRMMESCLKPYNLTHLQFSILVNLYKNNVSTQKELLKYTYGDEASITRLINRMESKGFLKRVPSIEDKRKKKIILTEEGINLTEEVLSCAKEVNNSLVEDLDEKENKQLLNLLQKVHNSIKS
ncbi:MarR family winged helix-turn-helix transcriptional regulator [Arcobacter arenosus]|uniref:Winged helix-turn-helix transcriptional regulator n=1 Tax=Arcobacter arenosus TaxID=2576037 RepID=A0A5R8Y2Z6_9BACT|nr:MarR family winged helix-turn-helix transcriptional regulator [Arcobacter arenosus]TLP39398.1 winged helix-turn-helix transcriptional regulator [Arcobacter arenosus]